MLARVDIHAVALLEADTVFAVTGSPHVGRFLAFHTERESGQVLVRAAELAEGSMSLTKQVSAEPRLRPHGEFVL